MKIVVVGAGKVGETLTNYLVKEKHNITVVDIDAEKIEEMVNKYDINVLVGNGLEREILMSAGVDSADFFITCSSRDELNILSCVIAKKLGAKYVIARVRDPEYANEIEAIKLDLGIDQIFNPERMTAKEISNVLKFPSAILVENFAHGGARLVELEVEEGNPIINKTIKEIVTTYNAKVLFALINRDGKDIIPYGDTIIEKDDHIYIIGADNDIINYLRKLHIYKHSAKNVFIIGGGKVSYYLAKLLKANKCACKIIENDRKRCEFLSNNLPNVDIVCADGTDTEILDEEGLKKADACITLTGLDEENAIISFYAISNGVKKVVTKVNNPHIYSIVENLGLDTIISPSNVVSNHLVGTVRSKGCDGGDGLRKLYRINDKIEVLEFIIGEDFTNVRIPIKSIKLKNGVLVGGIVRNGEFILPNGDTTFSVGDRVLIVSSKAQFNDINEIFG